MPEYFISTTGNNNNPGTIDKPFKTIQKCAEIAQAGDTCYIREGTYRETVTPVNSGQPGNPITFSAYQNEKVTISGADIIEGQWQEHENGIYKITLDPKLDRGIGNNQIFVDGEMMIEARWPNIDNAVGLTRDNHVISSEGELLEYQPKPDKNSYYLASSYYQSPELEQFPDGFWNQGYISFVSGYQWWGNVGEITKSNPGRIEFEFDFPTGWLKYHQPSGNDPFYLWGIYEVLDTEKEWYFDREGTQGTPSTLYLIPPGGTLDNKTIEIKTRDELFTLKNQSHIHIKEINFFAGRITTNKTTSHNIFDRILLDYAVYGQGLTGRVLSAVTLEGSSHQFLNSTIKNTASSGMQIKGTAHQVINNVIHDIGYVAAISDGIQMYDAAEIIVNQNTIFNSSSLGISALGKKSQINSNHIWHTGLQKTDTAGINAYNAGDAKGTEIAYNLVHDIVAHFNVKNKHYGGTGIRLDGGGSPLGSSNYRIHDNIVYNTSAGTSIAIWPLQESHPNYGNSQIFVNNNTVDTKIYLQTTNNNEVHAGTVVNNNIANEYGFGGGANVVPNGVTLENNLFYLTKIKNNLQGQSSLLGNSNDSLQDYLPIAESGIVISPATKSSIAQNNLELGARNVGVPGAVILESDLGKLSGLFNPDNPDLMTITEIPLGRKVPESFQVKLENGRVSSDCYNLTDIKTAKTTVNCEINLQDVREETVYVSLNGDNFQSISLKIDPSVNLPASQANIGLNFPMFFTAFVTLGVLGLVWFRRKDI
jgi:hypothetical protein